MIKIHQQFQTYIFLSFFHPEDKLKPQIYKRSVAAAVDWVSFLRHPTKFFESEFSGQLFDGNPKTFEWRWWKYNQVCIIVDISVGFEMTNILSMADLNDELDRLDKEYEVSGMPFEYDF